MLATVALPVCADDGDNDAPFMEPTEAPTESVAAPTPEENPLPSEGLCFNAYGTYALEKAFSAIPRTIEAEILLPTSVTKNAGAILSNEDKNGTDFYMTLDIVKGGVPRVIYKCEDLVRREFCFDEVTFAARTLSSSPS